ncbi:MAG: recombinase RecT [Agriterribacter sp.]
MSTENNLPTQAPPPSKTAVFKDLTEKDFVVDQFRNAIGDNYQAFVASLIDLYSGDGYLQQCDPKQVIMQAMKAAVLRLPINKSLGFAYIIAYKGIPQFQVGYKGLIQLAIRTGKYKHLHADEVYEGEYKAANKLTGEFDLNGVKKSDNVVGYFAHFELHNGFAKTLFMTTDKVHAHAKKFSPSYSKQSSPWQTDFPAMAKKTVVKNLLTHWGLLSIEEANALDAEQEQDVANMVQQEIKQKANGKTMQFDEAELAPEQGADYNNQPAANPGF